ncbi:hypothetical protein GCM10011344_18200 [Dokdonia pacifica]|nr:T9SS type A sorting domain-containing protein [Dokdonia pacifica]GGG17938.1 hypothetical protein GCM10011344_18200 [Dokdonia pacifica]
MLLIVGFIPASKANTIKPIDERMNLSMQQSEVEIQDANDFANLVANTVYIIDAVYSLENVNVVTPIPVGVTFSFEGAGMLLDNGALVGNNTRIVTSNNDNQIFDTVGEMGGTWDVPFIFPSWFGATDMPNSTDDDTLALQKAVSMGGNILLGEEYTITDTINITKNTTINSAFTANPTHTLIIYDTPNMISFVFTLQANVDVSIENVEIETNGLFELNSDASSIILRNNIVSNETLNAKTVIRNYNNIPRNIDSFIITGNHFEQVTVAFLDGTTSNELIFNDNVIRDCFRYLLRAESSADEEQGYISFQRNDIDGLRGNNAGDVARVLQASASTTIDYLDNTIRNIEGTAAANFIYWRAGNLNFIGNHCFDISSGTGAIHDKGLSLEYTVTIRDNVFDQSNTDLLVLPPEEFGGDNIIKRNPVLGIINISRAHNVNIENNEYLNLRTFALRISHPFTPTSDNSQLPENIVFHNNTVTNTNNKSVILVAPVVTNIDITNNCIDGLSNRRIETNHHPRFIEFSVNSSHPLAAVNDVVISRNTLIKVPRYAEMLWVNDGNFVCTSGTNIPAKINDVVISENSQIGGQSFVTFQGVNATGIRNLSITDNVYHNVLDITRGGNACLDIQEDDVTNVEVEPNLISCYNTVPIINETNPDIPKQKTTTIKLYPNPVTDVLTIESETVIKAISLQRSNGSFIKNIKPIEGKNRLNELNLENLAKGVYFLVIKTDTEIITKQIIKE